MFALLSVPVIKYHHKNATNSLCGILEHFRPLFPSPFESQSVTYYSTMCWVCGLGDHLCLILASFIHDPLFLLGGISELGQRGSTASVQRNARGEFSQCQ